MPRPPCAPPGGWGTVITLPAAPRLLGAAAPGGAIGGLAQAQAQPPSSSATSWLSLAAGLAGEVQPGLLLFLR